MMCKRHPTTTRDLGAPANWNPEDGHCGHLAIIDGPGPMMQSLWEPTPGELAALNRGGFVILTVMGNVHPPVAMSTHGGTDADHD